MKSETVPIDTLTLDPRNTRVHDERNLSTIAASLKRFGQVKPIVVDQKGLVVAGNGTVEAARSLGWTEVAAVRTKLKGAEASAYAIADNRTAELATWDEPALSEVLQELREDITIDETCTGFSIAEIDEYLMPTEVVEDDVPEPSDDPITKPGDLWRLCEHRVLCGDSTDAEDVGRVMSGRKAELCFTSPPYAQQREYTDASDTGDWDSLMRGVFGNLPMADGGQVLVNLGLIHRNNEWIPYWEGWIEWMRSQGWRRFGWYVWDQGAGFPGDWNGRLGPSHEWVFHFNKEATRPRKWIEKKEASIRVKRTGDVMGRDRDGTSHQIDSPHLCVQPMKIPDSVIRIGRRGGEYGHPAVFPVSFAAFILSSWLGDVYDPFLGSGTTLIAAEQLGRKLFGIEIEGRYCDVIVKRWENLTGKKATLAK